MKNMSAYCELNDPHSQLSPQTLRYQRLYFKNVVDVSFSRFEVKKDSKSYGDTYEVESI